MKESHFLITENERGNIKIKLQNHIFIRKTSSQSKIVLRRGDIVIAQEKVNNLIEHNWRKRKCWDYIEHYIELLYPLYVKKLNEIF